MLIVAAGEDFGFAKASAEYVKQVAEELQK
jgi:hypothetical protein